MGDERPDFETSVLHFQPIHSRNPLDIHQKFGMQEPKPHYQQQLAPSGVDSRVIGMSLQTCDRFRYRRGFNQFKRPKHYASLNARLASNFFRYGQHYVQNTNALPSR